MGLALPEIEIGGRVMGLALPEIEIGGRVMGLALPGLHIARAWIDASHCPGVGRLRSSKQLQVQARNGGRDTGDDGSC